MDVTITEKRLTEVLHKYLSTTIKGFDKCDYDWAEFGCGMGVCCDPYAIGFILPKHVGNYLESDNYLFKLVDSRFYDDDGDYPEEITGELPLVCKYPPDIKDSSYNTIIIYEELYESLRKLFGHIDIWRNPLLNIINNTYGLNATELLSDVTYDW